jgi:Transposase, Mutator family
VGEASVDQLTGLCRLRHKIHLIRSPLRYASRKYWPALTKHLRAIYTASDETAARTALETFGVVNQQWLVGKGPICAVVFVRVLDYDHVQTEFAGFRTNLDFPPTTAILGRPVAEPSLTGVVSADNVVPPHTG